LPEWGDSKPGTQPLPDDAWFTYDALCILFGFMTYGVLRVLVHRHRSELGPIVTRLGRTRGTTPVLRERCGGIARENACPDRPLGSVEARSNRARVPVGQLLGRLAMREVTDASLWRDGRRAVAGEGAA
jgi:hypothetical protein